jgi:hypothetical protein
MHVNQLVGAVPELLNERFTCESSFDHNCLNNTCVQRELCRPPPLLVAGEGGGDGSDGSSSVDML